MRLFLTSYQKSGTHQIYPMLQPNMPNIVDRSGIAHKGMDAWGFRLDYPRPGWEETAKKLREFDGKAFGHVAYMPEYAEAVQAQPTKVLFNMRDPRDIVVAEYEHIRTMISTRGVGNAWLNYRRIKDDKRIIELKDPLVEIIKVDAAKWRNWVGWLDHDFTVTVKYEDLRLHITETVVKLREQLAGCPIPTTAKMISGAKPTPSSPSFRLGKVGEWRRYFKPHHIELSNELLGYVIELFGYELGVIA